MSTQDFSAASRRQPALDLLIEAQALLPKVHSADPGKATADHYAGISREDLNHLGDWELLGALGRVHEFIVGILCGSGDPEVEQQTRDLSARINATAYPEVDAAFAADAARHQSEPL